MPAKILGRRVKATTKTPKGRWFKISGHGRIKGLKVNKSGKVVAARVASGSAPNPKKRHAHHKPKKKKNASHRKTKKAIKKRTAARSASYQNAKRKKKNPWKKLKPGSLAWVKKMAAARKRAAKKRRR